VRYRGRVFVRIGPRRDIANEEEERILTERRIAKMPHIKYIGSGYSGHWEVTKE